jgi:AraC-like DNA-binding protein
VSQHDWSPHGVVYAGKGSQDKPVHIESVDPSPALGSLVQCYWRMDWSLPPGKTIQSLVVPSGSVNVVFDPYGEDPVLRGRVVGVRETAYNLELKNSGRFLGVRFAPAGFSAFYGEPVSTLTNGRAALRDALPQFSASLLEKSLAAESATELAQLLNPFFELHLIPHDLVEVDLLVRIFQSIAASDITTTAKDISARFSVNERTLQRLFLRRVGVSLKSILKTRRFQSVADSLLAGGSVVWSEFALEMGYYDQSHLLNDFRAITEILLFMWATQLQAAI